MATNVPTDKQKQFMSEFHNGKKEPTPEFVYKGMVTVYLEADGKDKEYAAWLIRKLKPQYKTGLEDLININQLNACADRYQDNGGACNARNTAT